MEIEIVIVGEPNKWVLNQPRIRIGQDSKCEVCLPAGKYPVVSGEHAVLDMVGGVVSLARGRYSSCDIYLNGRPASDGSAVRSGDLLRLGAGGPELRIRVMEQADSRQTEYEPTRVMYQVPSAAPSAHEPTRMMQEPSRTTHEATRVISGPVATSYSPAPPPAAGPTVRQGYSTQASYGVSSSPYAPSASPATPRRADAGTNAVAAPSGYGQLRAQETTAQAAAARVAESETMRSLEDKLKSIRLILMANLALVALLLVWIFMQGRELAQTHKDLQALRVQAQSAVGQLTPSLDARLSVFEKRMDGMDEKIAVAQDRMVKGMDAGAKLAEDRMVDRMNAEIPLMLDKYVNKKMTDLKH